MKIEYASLLGPAQGAAKIHVHLTHLEAEIGGQSYQHSHQAEEAIYLLDGQAEYTVGGQVCRVGPGELIFFPPGEPHGVLRLLKTPDEVPGHPQRRARRRRTMLLRRGHATVVGRRSTSVGPRRSILPRKRPALPLLTGSKCRARLRK